MRHGCNPNMSGSAKLSSRIHQKRGAADANDSRLDMKSKRSSKVFHAFSNVDHLVRAVQPTSHYRRMRQQPVSFALRCRVSQLPFCL
jgi:hypothetical protein